ncbi:MAG: iron ABC transporter permease [Bdellovibrionales bacterium]|nr:iron ABC transporter permease [Bdellovibrionales bacterium]
MESVKRVFFSQKFILGSALLILFGLCVYPFAILFYTVLFPKEEFSLEFLSAVLSHKSALRALKNTVLTSFAIATLSGIIAIPLAWLVTRTNLPWASRFRSWFCLPYAIPPYIGAIAWIYLANPTTGYINQIFGEGFVNIYSYGGLIWVQTTFLYTFILLAALSALDKMDPSLEEAARLSGAGPFRVFKDITLPLIQPALWSGGLLVGLASAASFGVPALIGSPARIFLMTTQIYTFQKMGSMSGIFKAGALSILLLLVALALLLLSQKITSKKRYQIVSGKTARPSLIDLGPWKLPSVSVLFVLLFILFLMPLGSIILTSLSEVQGSFGSLGFANYHRVLFEMSETGRALWNSFSLGILSATAATALAILLAYMGQKTKIPGRAWLDILASLPYSIPGTVVALALILAFSAGFFGIGPSLYNTLAMLWLAYMVKYLSLAMKTIGDGYGQIDDSLAEAARVAGASWAESLKSIWLPLMKPSIVAAWFLIFMPAFSELTMTILLAGPGTETLGTLIFQLQEYADASGGGSAVLAVIVVLSVLITNTLVKIFSKGKYGL